MTRIGTILIAMALQLTTPTPNVEAVAGITRRVVTPTDLKTAELQQLSAAWKRNSFFSAQTLLEDLLRGYQADVLKLVNPQRVARDGVMVTEGLSLAKAREQAKTLLDALGYEPDPELRGTLQDLSSDGRIELVLKTNVEIAQGESWWLQGQDETILDAYPAQELFRGEARVKERDWLLRWRLAGQATGTKEGWTMSDGKMVAVKNHPIWEELGNPKLFPDGLGNPFPPFAFGSGMDTRDWSRKEAEAVGVIEPGQRVPAMTLDDLNR